MASESVQEKLSAEDHGKRSKVCEWDVCPVGWEYKASPAETQTHSQSECFLG